MFPTLIRIGDFEIATYGFMVAIGFLAGWALALRRARGAGLDEKQFTSLVVTTLLAAIVGAKVFHVIVNWGTAPLTRLVFARSGLVYYGGFLFAVGAVVWLTRRRGWDLRVVADVLAPSIPLGQFFGRLGCFFNGCCYGRVCSEQFGTRFPRVINGDQIVGSEPYLDHYSQGLLTLDEAWSLPVIPTQILSAVLGAVFCGILIFYVSPRRRFVGQVFLTYAVLYSIGRFGIEMLRADPRGTWPGGLTTSQGVSVALLVAAVWGWRHWRKLPPPQADCQ